MYLSNLQVDSFVAEQAPFRMISTTVINLLENLRDLDTACLCDADKSLAADASRRRPLSLMHGLRPLTSGNTISGVARTVQCMKADDFLAVLDGMTKAEEHEILVVNTLNSSRAVAGELFCAEASRRRMQGVIVDGPMRDTKYLKDFATVRCFSRSVTPYSGTGMHLGENQAFVDCGGVKVQPGDIIVADDDGIIVGSANAFEALVPIAKDISLAEQRVRDAIVKDSKCLHSLTNFESHAEAIRKGISSALKFL